LTLIGSLVRLARPKDWLKNAFVLMPVPFALASGGTLELRVFMTGLVAMCLAGSAVYALNDTRDAALDRLHPRKRNRPVASGAVPVPVAVIFGFALALTALALAVATGLEAPVLLIATYLGINAIYNFGGKHVPLVDVFLLSSGHVLRVFLGCALVAVSASNWLLLCSSTLALFLTLTKRRGDVVMGLDETHRPSLQGYNLQFLDQAMGVTAGIALLSYALYAIEAGVFMEGREFASLPFVAFGILDYLRVAHLSQGDGNPVDVLLSRPTFLFAGLGGVGTVAWSLGL